KTHRGKATFQPRHGINRIACAHLRFDVGDAQMRMRARHLARVRKPLLERCCLSGSLQRILWGYEPPHIVESQALQCHLAGMNMPFMGRIERASEQTYSQTRSNRAGRLQPYGASLREPRHLQLSVLAYALF